MSSNFGSHPFLVKESESEHKNPVRISRYWAPGPFSPKMTLEHSGNKKNKKDHYDTPK